MADLLCGQVLSFAGDPFETGEAAARHLDQGAVLVDRGKVVAVGDASALRAAHPQAKLHDYGRALISAGFIDAHVHYPQTAIIASWGKRLIDWLNLYTFPEEMRFADPAYADDIANRYLDLITARGITTVCSYATIHPASVDAIFTAAQARGMRLYAGKTCMDRNAPEGLRDTSQSAYDESKALLNKSHGVDRLSYVITPRFSPTSTPEQLAALGALCFTFFPDTYVIEISVKNDNIRSIEVFETNDSAKVSLYNVKSTDNFIITKSKTSFPSELEIGGDGTVKTYGGLILVKLNLKDKEKPVFEGDVHLKYRTAEGDKIEENYPFTYETPGKEQYYSDECLYEALSCFFYVHEVKSILEAIK